MAKSLNGLSCPMVLAWLFSPQLTAAYSLDYKRRHTYTFYGVALVKNPHMHGVRV